MKMKLNTKALETATLKSLRRLRDESELLAASTSVGIYFPPTLKQKKGCRRGIQIFVQAFLYDESVKRILPHTGGLLAYVGKNISRQD